MLSQAGRIGLGTVFVVAAAAFASPSSTDSAMLQRKFESGVKHYYELTTHVDQTISGKAMPGGEMKVKVLYLTGVWEEAQSTPDGKKVTITFDRIKQHMDIPAMGEMDYDTDDPDNEDAAPQLASLADPMVGERLTIQFANDNTVKDFHGMKEIAEKISKKAQGNPFWMQMRSRYTDEVAQREWAEAPMRYFPNRVVKVGEEWRMSEDEDDPQLGKTRHTYVYHLDKVSSEGGKRMAHVSFTGAIEGAESSAGDADKSNNAKSAEADKKAAADTKPEGQKPGAKLASNKRDDDAKDGDEDEDDDDDGDEEEAGPPKRKVSGAVKGSAVIDLDRGIATKTNADVKLHIEVEGGPMGGGGVIKVDVQTHTTRVLQTEQDRKKQKAEMAAKIEARKKAEAEEDAAYDDEEEDESDE